MQPFPFPGIDYDDYYCATGFVNCYPLEKDPGKNYSLQNDVHDVNNSFKIN